MKHRRYPSATARDWSIVSWVAIDIFRKMGATLFAAIVVAVCAGAILLHAILATYWPYILAFVVGILGLKILRHFDRNRPRPVPWDRDYDPRQDDDIPF